jgi:hypothetical protein
MNTRPPQQYCGGWTDSKGRIQVLLLLALGHCLTERILPWKSAVLSTSYLCLSVPICGCSEM